MAHFAVDAVLQSVSVRAVPGATVFALVFLSFVFAIPSTAVFALGLSSPMDTDASTCRTSNHLIDQLAKGLGALGTLLLNCY